MHRIVIAALALVAAVSPLATTATAGKALGPGSLAAASEPRAAAGLFVPTAAAIDGQAAVRVGQPLPSNLFTELDRTVASSFELTLEAADTMRWDDELIFDFKREGTFRSGAPFCATGTFVDEGYSPPGVSSTWRFTCDDGTGSLIVSIAQMSGPRWNTTWHILDGSGDYAGLRGRGSLEGEVLGHETSDSGSVTTWRSTFQGVVDHDAVAPTITLLSATATKLRRPAGTYVLRLGIALRDDVAGNPVSYTVRASGPGGREWARTVGTARTEAVSIKLRIRPLAGARTVRLELIAEDPVGNTAYDWPRPLRLPR